MIPKMIVHPSDCHVEPTVQLPTSSRLPNDDVNSRRDNGDQKLSTSNVDTAGIKEPAQPESPPPEIVGQADGRGSLEYHSLCLLFPQANRTRLTKMAKDIRKKGLLEAIVLYEGLILDGRNRYLACLKAGVEPRFVEYKGEDPLEFVLSKNLHRRHLNKSQRAMIAETTATLPKGSNQHAKFLACSIENVAEQFNVSDEYIRQARNVRTKAIPEVVKAVVDGKVSVSCGVFLADLSEEKQRELLAQGKKAITTAVREAKQAKPKSLPKQSSPPYQATKFQNFRTLRERICPHAGRVHSGWCCSRFNRQ